MDVELANFSEFECSGDLATAMLSDDEENLNGYEEQGEENPTEEMPETESEDTHSLSVYIKDLRSYKLLTKEEEVDLALRAGNGDMLAKEQLITHNLRLVVSVAKKFAYKGVEIEDLIQLGNLGLIKAVDMFDPTLGYKFSTYAMWWIRQAIMRGIADTGKTVRLPVHLHEKLLRMKNVTRELEQENGITPTPAQIAERVGWTEKTVEHLMVYMRGVQSLDIYVGDEQDTPLMEFVPDDAPTPEEVAMKNDDRRAAWELMGNLTNREKQIIIMRYGLETGEERTLESVGEELHVTRERIRQIEAKALKKMKAAWKRKIHTSRFQYFAQNNC